LRKKARMLELLARMQKALAERAENDALRVLRLPNPDLVDFYSNDYLGLSKNPKVLQASIHAISEGGEFGSGASRLISGNRVAVEQFEEFLARFHDVESALFFNSGYAANQGLISCMATRHDTILYDELIHASLREGLALSHAAHFSFRHNDLEHLNQRLQRAKGQVFIISESVFSMDGDEVPLLSMLELAEKHGAALVIDEAHAVGVVGPRGEGLVQKLGLQDRIWARIPTFGKALGGHGAAVLGPKYLKDYLINFSKPLIYTTAAPAHVATTLLAAYQIMLQENTAAVLQQNIQYFLQKLGEELKPHFIPSRSAIHCLLWPGNSAVRELSRALSVEGIGVWPILHPTVPKGQERLRICLHAYNTRQEIDLLINVLTKYV
jgi:8-amino-7-oxononanoate synthase